MWKPGSAGYGFQANPTNTALAASLHRRCPCQHHRRLVPPGTGSDGALDAQSSSSIDYGASGARTSTNRGTLGAHTSDHCDAHPFTGRGSSAHRSPRHSSKGGRGGEEAVHGGALRMAAPAAAVHGSRGNRPSPLFHMGRSRLLGRIRPPAGRLGRAVTQPPGPHGVPSARAMAKPSLFFLPTAFLH